SPPASCIPKIVDFSSKLSRPTWPERVLPFSRRAFWQCHAAHAPVTRAAPESPGVARPGSPLRSESRAGPAGERAARSRGICRANRACGGSALRLLYIGPHFAPAQFWVTSITVDSSDEVLADRVGQSVGPWKLERLIGIGGMAAVYEATGPGGRRGALKLLHPEMARRPDVRERFLREGSVPNQIDHPGLVKVEQFGQTEQNEAYLVMELLEGESLAARIDRVGVLPLEELLSYMDQILDVLAAAHDKKIIH